MELVFLASGAGQLAERRELARANPSQGALDAPQPAAEGSPRVARFFQGISRLAGLQEGTRGGIEAHPAPEFYALARGDDHRVSAAVALGRPLVPKGQPAVPADVVARPRDNVDSEQEVAATVQSLVHASTAGGAWGARPRRGIGSRCQWIRRSDGERLTCRTVWWGGWPFFGMDY